MENSSGVSRERGGGKSGPEGRPEGHSGYLDVGLWCVEFGLMGWRGRGWEELVNTTDLKTMEL